MRTQEQQVVNFAFSDVVEALNERFGFGFEYVEAKFHGQAEGGYEDCSLVADELPDGMNFGVMREVDGDTAATLVHISNEETLEDAVAICRGVLLSFMNMSFL